MRRTWIRAALLAPVLSTMLMAGQCSTLSGGPGTGGSYCDIATVRRPSQATLATLAPDEKRRLLVELRYYQTHCGPVR